MQLKIQRQQEIRLISVKKEKIPFHFGKVWYNEKNPVCCRGGEEIRMKCHYCGNEVTEEQKFCMRCGTKLEKQPEPVVQPEPEAQSWNLEPAKDLFWEEEPAPAPAAQEPAPVYAPQVQPVMAEIPVREAVTAPLLKLPTSRGLAKMFFLGILTLGIYPIVIWSKIVTELNIAASRYDGQRTMPYFAMCTLAPITLGIYVWVWIHGFCNRIGVELQRRGIDYKFGASTFWLWGVLGSLIFVGPFIYIHKLMKAMNLINADFNEKG